MLITRAYQTELDLNKEQATACKRHAGAARYAYNWGLAQKKERHYLPTSGVNILSATGSEQAGHWYVSVQVEQKQTVPENTGPVVGVDLGVKSLATFSDGTVIPNPRHLKRRLKKIKCFHRAISRKQKGSKNRRKATNRLAPLYRALINQRKNTLHQLTTTLAKTKQVIVIEDLHVTGMPKNHHLAQAIADVGFGEFRRQLLYRQDKYLWSRERWHAACAACETADKTRASCPKEAGTRPHVGLPICLSSGERLIWSKRT